MGRPIGKAKKCVGERSGKAGGAADSRFSLLREIRRIELLRLSV